MSKDDDDDEVGYKKPPVKSRFRKGQSGNPRGRPKKDPSVSDFIRKYLRAKIYVTLDGVKKRITRREAIALRVVNDALSGARDHIRIAMATDDAGAGKESPENCALSADDEAILDAFVEEVSKSQKRKRRKKSGGNADG